MIEITVFTAHSNNSLIELYIVLSGTHTVADIAVRRRYIFSFPSQNELRLNIVSGLRPSILFCSNCLDSLYFERAFKLLDQIYLLFPNIS